ncbi:histone arginine methyltransferase prmt3 [Cystoisospora suis]|uniref:Histone arginine methyltransferase prmt3 n=1 Tax=Cystoisospora suis TaxID=483139 RepID=A0A2C6KNM2_9APIC|nr:histone arginine methyltransferase prmt3 [Cystoisospora suis]
MYLSLPRCNPDLCIYLFLAAILEASFYGSPLLVISLALPRLLRSLVSPPCSFSSFLLFSFSPVSSFSLRMKGETEVNGYRNRTNGDEGAGDPERTMSILKKGQKLTKEEDFTDEDGENTDSDDGEVTPDEADDEEEEERGDSQDSSFLLSRMKRKQKMTQEGDEEEDGEDEEYLRLPPFYCLFCTFASRDLRCIYTHMHSKHGLNLADPKGLWHPRRAPIMTSQLPSSPSSLPPSSSSLLQEDTCCSSASSATLLLPPLTSYFRISLVNFLRSLAPSLGEKERQIDEEEGCEEFPSVVREFSQLSKNSPCWIDEKYLHPVWFDDRLLWEGGEEDEDDDEEEEEMEEREKRGGKGEEEEGCKEEEMKKRQFERKREEDAEKRGEEEVEMDRDRDSLRKRKELNEEDKNYFAGYAEVHIHREMIRDTARTEAYRNFILHNKDYFRDKVVLDVGCGSSILSLFCAQAGARKVIGVDAAVGIAEIAEKIVKRNGFDQTVDIICAKLEDVMLVWTDDHQERVTTVRRSDLPKKSQGVSADILNRKVAVDIIVSEWMGYALLFESMLYTVLHARDEYLRPHGLLVPSRAILGLCAAGCRESLAAMRGEFDKPCYSLDLSLLHIPDQRLLEHAEVRSASPRDLLSSPHPFCCLDLYRVSKASIQTLRCPFTINLESSPVHPSPHSSSSSSSPCASSFSAPNGATDSILTSLVLYFDCLFEVNRPPTVVPPGSRTMTPSHTSGDGSPATSSSSIIPDVYYFDSTSHSSLLATASHGPLHLPKDFLKSLVGPTTRTIQETDVSGLSGSTPPGDPVHVNACMNGEAIFGKKNGNKTLQTGEEKQVTSSPKAWLSKDETSNGSVLDRERYLDESTLSSLCTSSSTTDYQTSASSPAASPLHDARTNDRKEEEKREEEEEKTFSCCLSTSPLCRETHWKQTIFHLLGPDLRGLELRPAWATKILKAVDIEAHNEGDVPTSTKKNKAGNEDNSASPSPILSTASLPPSVHTLQGYISLNPDPEKPRSLVVTVELKDLPFLRDNDGKEELLPVLINSFSVS